MDSLFLHSGHWGRGGSILDRRYGGFIVAEVYTLKDADAVGRAHGFDLARAVINEGIIDDEGITRPFDEALEVGITPGELSASFWDTLWDSVDHFRQYSPFEFHAAAINRRSDADAGWAAYDAGFERGARVALRAAGLGALI